MAYRRDRSIRAAYDEHFHSEREMPYGRVVNLGERRGEFNRTEEDYHRDYDYDGPRYHPNGGPRSYHGDDHRGYPENAHFGNVRRNGPPSRREEGLPYYRGAREEPPGGRQVEFRDDRDNFRRKGSFPPQRDRSPLKRDAPSHSPHSRSGSSVSSRGFSPERGKSYSFQKLPKSNKERVPGQPVTASRDGSPQSTVSATKVTVEKPSRPVEGPPPKKAEETPERATKVSETHKQIEEIRGLEGEQDDVIPVKDDATKAKESLQERRSKAIAAKAREIEQVFRQDCETFGMVVKMLVAKDPSLESQLQTPLRENLDEIQQRCLEDLRHFISELDEVLQPEVSG
ncbi:hypothetical protein GJAV_G00164670 [Gymnothorax javanicus]|nr:hypothetical protein GJAV_G00164670 [Gymnothorax javanicus]